MFEITTKNRTYPWRVDEKPVVENGRVKFNRLLKNGKDKIVGDYPYEEVSIVEIEGTTVESYFKKLAARKDENPNEE